MREPSHLRAALGLVLHSLRAGAEGAAIALGAPKRRPAVERQGIRVDPKRVAAYRRVTGGEGAGSAPLPPTYPALWETALALELLRAAEIPLPSRGLLHLESGLLQIRPLHPNDRPRCRVELDRADPHPQGLRLSLVGRTWNAGGQLCLEDTMVLLARLPGAAGGRRPPGGSREGREDGGAGEWREVREWDLRSDLGRRYARVSGDFNPIHLWSWSSRPFGFRRPILHGFCLQALVANALIGERLGGDPAALRRLSIAFRAPLLLPCRVRLLVAGGREGGGGRFRVVAQEAEGRPLAEGEFGGVTDTAAPSSIPLPPG